MQRRRWKLILYLHLDYNNTTKMMEINLIFTVRLQQYHGDDGNQFYIFPVDYNNTTEMMEINFIFTFGL